MASGPLECLIMFHYIVFRFWNNNWTSSHWCCEMFPASARYSLLPVSFHLITFSHLWHTDTYTFITPLLYVVTSSNNMLSFYFIPVLVWDSELTFDLSLPSITASKDLAQTSYFMATNRLLSWPSFVALWLLHTIASCKQGTLSVSNGPLCADGFWDASPLSCPGWGGWLYRPRSQCGVLYKGPELAQWGWMPNVKCSGGLEPHGCLVTKVHKSKKTLW